ncbi:OST-HTH/LOTUS domain-containing protein [Oscillochloris sp. ZM17-4]|nr:OST-HTH/LOTUS domain-containing protein [Oscillochloris sp. ZM17-4]
MLGSHLTKLRSDFDARNFGYRKLSDLVRAHPDLFELDDREVAGSPTEILYVRAKQ